MKDRQENFWPAMGLSSSKTSTYLGLGDPSNWVCFSKLLLDVEEEEVEVFRELIVVYN
jgi:hypothetical protein